MGLGCSQLTRHCHGNHSLGQGHAFPKINNTFTNLFRKLKTHLSVGIMVSEGERSLARRSPGDQGGGTATNHYGFPAVGVGSVPGEGESFCLVSWGHLHGVLKDE